MLQYNRKLLYTALLKKAMKICQQKEKGCACLTDADVFGIIYPVKNLGVRVNERHSFSDNRY